MSFNILSYIVGTTKATSTVVFNPLNEDLKMLAAGSFMRNVFMGGSLSAGMKAEATGDIILPDWRPIQVPNTSNRISGSPSVVVRARCMVRVSNAAISATPKIYNVTDAAAATISGQLGCSATLDDYSGVNQQQTVLITLPSGLKAFQPRITVGGTPAGGYQVWALFQFDCYVDI